MPPLSPVTVPRLVAVAAAAAAAPRGGKQAVYDAACAELGLSLATLHRRLHDISLRPVRRQRSDAGDLALSRDEAIAISALLMSSHRKSEKRLLSIGQAVDTLRANGEVRAERIDEASGEVAPLSNSAIARALRHYCLHPDQLLRPAPAVELRSLHPNHVWQIDASLCVLYYLDAATPQDSGLRVMEHTRFYKNKPANLKRIEADRVWSYEVTDHCSGAIDVNYVMGAESGKNLADSFIKFIQKRSGHPVHGVPLMLAMDPGSANTSGLFASLTRRLQIETLVHAPGAARATGQVENARNLIERNFESRLRLVRQVHDLAALNALAETWVRYYNGQMVHSRHGMTRYDMWMRIQPAQLRIAPPVELCQELLTHTPDRRKVSVTLTVQFKGREYDVSQVPNVTVGEPLQVTYNPYQQDAATIIDRDADGNELLHSVPAIERNDYGFRTDGNVIGEDWRRPADTPLQTNRKEVDRFTYDAATDAEAEDKRRRKAIPFGGRIDPYKPITDAPERVFLDRRGESMALTAQPVKAVARTLTQFEAARELASRGVAMNRELVATLQGLYPDGVPEDELDALAQRLTVRAGLRVVTGGAAS